jgi:putative Mg2+ transporter-C (MgtC) family protein
MPDLSTLEALARLGLAAALGGAVGLERELRDHEAGLRTHLLVSLGAALFTLVSAYAWSDWQFSARSGVTLDPTRIAAQIVSGVGFLGAGAIIVRGISVKGLTTAASVWVVAAIGMACGAGFYFEALGATLLALVSLYPLRLWSRRLLGDMRSVKGTLHVEVENGGRSLVVEEAERLCGRPLHIDMRDETVTLDVRAGNEGARLVSAIAKLDGVKRVEWAP